VDVTCQRYMQHMDSDADPPQLSSEEDTTDLQMACWLNLSSDGMIAFSILPWLHDPLKRAQIVVLPSAIRLFLTCLRAQKHLSDAALMPAAPLLMYERVSGSAFEELSVEVQRSMVSATFHAINLSAADTLDQQRCGRTLSPLICAVSALLVCSSVCVSCSLPSPLTLLLWARANACPPAYDISSACKTCLHSS
jgi:hypothetical protein